MINMIYICHFYNSLSLSAVKLTLFLSLTLFIVTKITEYLALT